VHSTTARSRLVSVCRWRGSQASPPRRRRGGFNGCAIWRTLFFARLWPTGLPLFASASKNGIASAVAAYLCANWRTSFLSSTSAREHGGELVGELPHIIGSTFRPVWHVRGGL
jgi:hypothetical protein